MSKAQSSGVEYVVIDSRSISEYYQWRLSQNSLDMALIDELLDP